MGIIVSSNGAVKIIAGNEGGIKVKPYYQDEAVTIYHGDCREILPDMPQVDLILTDPQFFLPPVGHGTRGREDDFCGSLGDLVMLESAYEPIFNQFKRILSVDGQLYVNCHDRSYPVFYRLAYTRFPRVNAIVWYKPTGRVGDGWRRSYELLLHARTSRAKYSEGFTQDVIGIMPVRTLNRQHPAEKPIDLADFIISRVQDVKLLIDSFMGAGSYIVAAKRNNIRSIGIEIDERYCEIAANRCNQMVMNLT